MDDLTLLRELGHEFDPPTTGPSLATRERVAAATARGGRRSPRRIALRRLTPALGAGLAGVLALVLLLPGHPYDGPAAPGAHPGTTSGETPTSAAPALDARNILLAAAATARAGAAGPPPPDAFVYTRSLEAWDGRRGERESWSSVDGRRDGAVTPSWSTHLVAVPGCPRSGTVRHRKGTITSLEPCTPRPAYHADAPANADAAARMLLADGATTGTAFRRAAQLLAEDAFPPGSVAAVLEALSRLPGITVAGGVRTLSGRRGIAVAVVVPPPAATTVTTTAGGLPPVAEQHGLIMDARTHQVLGGWDGAGEQLRPGGYVWEIVAQGIVPEVRIRPDGSRRGGPIDRDGA